MATIAGAVLAAGAGRRMGQPKATLVLNGERLIDSAVRALVHGGCAPVFAVVRSGLVASAATAIVNPDPDQGQRSSLECAVKAAEGADALAIVLVDVPGMRGDVVRSVVCAWRPGRIAVAVAAGRPTHPTVMSLALWHQAIALARADEGARRMLRQRPTLVDEVAVEFDPADIDTPQQLAARER